MGLGIALQLGKTPGLRMVAAIDIDLAQAKRAAELLKEEMELMGAIRLRDVEKAQQDIVGITRKLEEEGLITIGATAGEPYVV